MVRRDMKYIPPMNNKWPWHRKHEHNVLVNTQSMGVSSATTRVANHDTYPGTNILKLPCRTINVKHALDWWYISCGGCKRVTNKIKSCVQAGKLHGHRRGLRLSSCDFRKGHLLSNNKDTCPSMPMLVSWNIEYSLHVVLLDTNTLRSSTLLTDFW